MATTKELVEDGRIYVLRERPEHVKIGRGRYYTGKKPSRSISDAKKYTLKTAKGVQKFAHTGWCYNIVRVTDKMVFVMLLSDK